MTTDSLHAAGLRPARRFRALAEICAITCLVCLVGGLSPATADEPPQINRDGTWWLHLGEGAPVAEPAKSSFVKLIKAAYVWGISDGQMVAVDLITKGWIDDPNDVPDAREWHRRVEQMDRAITNYMGRQITTSQMSDGLNTFYADYRNRAILVSRAVFVVLREIAGDDHASVDEAVRTLRQNAGNK